MLLCVQPELETVASLMSRRPCQYKHSTRAQCRHHLHMRLDKPRYKAHVVFEKNATSDVRPLSLNFGIKCELYKSDRPVNSHELCWQCCY